MSEWLSPSLSSGGTASPALLGWRIGTGLLLGLAVARLYRWARRDEVVEPALVTTLVMLAVVIAMATQVIGDNVARAFSLVGALSVVRFRTVVKDTQDTAFVILAVVVGMAAGANQLGVALVGLALLSLAAALILWPPSHLRGPEPVVALLHVRAGLAEGVRDRLSETLVAASQRFHLTAVATVRQGTALDISYRILLHSEATIPRLVIDLYRIEGIESVDLRVAD